LGVFTLSVAFEPNSAGSINGTQIVNLLEQTNLSLQDPQVALRFRTVHLH